MPVVYDFEVPDLTGNAWVKHPRRATLDGIKTLGGRILDGIGKRVDDVDSRGVEMEFVWRR